MLIPSYVIAPEIDYDQASWVDHLTISFMVNSESSPSANKEIVLWDIPTETVINRYAVSSSNFFSWLAEGGEFILSSHLASGILQFILILRPLMARYCLVNHVGEYSWLPSGFLAYCGIDEDGHKSDIIYLGWGGNLDRYSCKLQTHSVAEW